MSEARASDLSVFHTDRLELSFAPKLWEFAEERKAEIAAYFTELQRRKPSIWNGRVLLLHSRERIDGVFRGAYFETDFASFSAWRDWGRPPAKAYDCNGAAAIISADGAVLLGVMAAHTFNAGRIYFPCGTPDPADIIGGKVDIEFSVRRELAEETGLDATGFTTAPGWMTVVDGPLIMQIKTLRSEQSAETLRTRMLAHLAREEQPELSGIRIVRGPGDYDPAMPSFARAYLDRHFEETGSGAYQTPGTRR
jgi:hypothetical protein